MAIKILPDGSVVADTPDEAVAYQLALAKAGSAPKKPAASPGGWIKLCESLQGSNPKKTLQRKLLALVKQDGATEMSDLAKQLKEHPQTIAGHISGLRKRATTAGIAPDDLLTKEGTKVLAGQLLRLKELPQSW